MTCVWWRMLAVVMGKVVWVGDCRLFWFCSHSFTMLRHPCIPVFLPDSHFLVPSHKICFSVLLGSFSNIPLLPSISTPLSGCHLPCLLCHLLCLNFGLACLHCRLV